MKKTAVLFFVAAFVCLLCGSFAATIPTKGFVNPDIGLYVRKGPGMSYASITALTKNTQVTILSVSGSWYKITSGSITGYVYGTYITVTESEETDDSKLSPEEAEKVGQNLSRSASNAVLTSAP